MIVKCECGREFNDRGGRYGQYHWDKCKHCRSKEYQRTYMRQYRIDNPTMEKDRLEKRRQDPSYVESERARGRKYWSDLRHEAFMAYGGYVCNCCGETEPKFLTIDHRFNDGAKHREKIRNRGSGIFKWLRDQNYPYGFQVLCFNCNLGKAQNGGVCPARQAGRHCYDPAKSGPSYDNRVNSGNLLNGQSRAKPAKREGVSTRGKPRRVQADSKRAATLFPELKI